MDRKFKCTHNNCKFSSTRKDLLNTHINETHKKKLKLCICGKRMTAAALSRHKKTCCPMKNSDSNSSTESIESNQSNCNQSIEMVPVDEFIQENQLACNESIGIVGESIGTDVLVENNNLVAQSIVGVLDNGDDLTDLPVEIAYDVIGDDLNRSLNQMNISSDEIVSITECHVKIIKLSDGRIACLHDELNLDGLSLSIVPSNTFQNLNG